MSDSTVAAAAREYVREVRTRKAFIAGRYTIGLEHEVMDARLHIVWEKLRRSIDAEAQEGEGT